MNPVNFPYPLPATARYTSISLLITLAILFSNALQGAEKDRFNLREIAENVYLHTGKQASFRSSSSGDIANLGFIAGKKCIAVIDSGGSVHTGKQLRLAIRKISKKPICYVINTHVHFDHVLGNVAFREDNPEFVGHQALGAAIINNRDFFLESFADNLGPDKKPDWIIGPTIKVAKTLTIDLGGRKLKLRAHGTAHTNNDLTVYDQQTNTLWASDLLFVRHIPVLNGSINGWIQESEKLLDSSASVIVPGHGPVAQNWKGAVTTQATYLKQLRSDIIAILNTGGTIEQAIDTAGRKNSNRWHLFDEYHRRNVIRAFTELEWE